MYQKINGPGRLQLVLDSSQVFPDDPGNGTPALVYLLGPSGNIVADATYNCALGEGELCDNHGRTVTLTPKQIEWLDSMDSEVEKVYDVA